jgi:hypothetical protein
MGTRLIAAFVVAVGLSSASVQLFAHHGSAAFDVGKQVTVQGTVVEWIWANPHCLLQFDVVDENGQMVRWVTETSNPPDMINRGWTKSSFKAGDHVVATVEPAKSGKPVGRLLQVVLPSGKTLSGGFGGARGAGAPAPAAAPSAPAQEQEKPRE